MVRNHVDAECVALDNQKFRNVAERHCPGEQPFHRFRVDLLHANLAQIEPLRSSAHKHAVIVGKHVCGAATDFSLRALRVLVPGNQCPLGTPANQEHLSCIDAIAIATCCHHRCEWKHFVNTPLFLQLGLTAADFHWMCAISSWAVCEVVERQPSRSVRADSAIDTDVSHQPADQTTEHEKPESAGVSSLHANHRINQVLSPQERTLLGRRCKRLIDYGRVQYLSERGYDSWYVFFDVSIFNLRGSQCNFAYRLVSYVDQSITKENTLLLAVPKQAGH
jgi:tRNA:m4X modification enzyme